ncbi:hypothetical protein QJ850_gp920 [Acanthamoeba polyphaga mimivirus]|uniref:Uncharacterized protein n=1 Tax=Acanthamoeba polyphaga mimivirus Kroon TaxID=3069720 RepID=A0A0G2Y5D4_9VIRU|nr:hypothetical protein QJ850_gp920 [Acanthamoeba polyphaga mimivirus]AKI79779.1 hypothetical protein [Acanthamoeba polyphaga mimivirus Kroon]
MNPSIIIGNDFNFDKYLEQFKDFYYCGDKKYLFCDKNTLMELKDLNKINVYILLTISFIIEVKEKIISLKKLKNNTEIQLVRLILNPDNSTDEIGVTENLRDVIDKYSSEINECKNDLIEICNFKKFLKIFRLKNL